MKKTLIFICTISLIFALSDVSAKGPKNKEKEDGDKKEKVLPKGLQKKLERGGQLPPGWQKKLVKGYRLEDDIYRHAHVIDHSRYPDVPIGVEGSVVVRIDDRLVRLARATREILEIIK
ncbi:hypothetical protein [Aliikangiella sp. G2MR2-5]|uniref:hypothetical protein n=1 Tax=Aliikangiella sp. G2MR2-5 TaxID=2788943 RepID=UPI0018AA1C5B|nr:hypothetical protein [Aliikangiella sp. G2MR2-5]